MLGVVSVPIYERKPPSLLPVPAVLLEQGNGITKYMQPRMWHLQWKLVKRRKTSLLTLSSGLRKQAITNSHWTGLRSAVNLISEEGAFGCTVTRRLDGVLRADAMFLGGLASLALTILCGIFYSSPSLLGFLSTTGLTHGSGLVAPSSRHRRARSPEIQNSVQKCLGRKFVVNLSVPAPLRPVTARRAKFLFRGRGEGGGRPFQCVHTRAAGLNGMFFDPTTQLVCAA